MTEMKKEIWTLQILQYKWKIFMPGKSNTYTESKLFPYVREEHLRTDLMQKVRRLISNNNPRHEWLKMSDKELMVSAGLYETDFVTGEQGYNLAAILLFGKMR